MRFYYFLAIFFLLVDCSSANNPGWNNVFNHPTSFCENTGQFKSPDGQNILYAYDDGCYRVYFTSTGLVYNFTVVGDRDTTSDNYYPEKEIENKNRPIYRDYVVLNWENANSNVSIQPSEQTSDYYSYVFMMNGQEKNLNYIRGFRKITYKSVYPGIDIEYTIHPEGGIKYAFVVSPGADISQIRMKYSKDISIYNNEIIIPSDFGNIIDHAPKTFYQTDDITISSAYTQINNNTIGFNLGSYDNTKTIVIDPWTQNPVLNNTKKIWEIETDVTGNVYIYGGDMPVRILKYNSAGTLLWNYASAIDTANYWLGGMVTNQFTGESYISAGSIGKLWKISTAGAMVWSNTPAGSCEYWSLSFNCDGTKLAIGGSNGIFSIRGYMFNINLGTGAQSGTRLIGYGSMGFPPTMQEASSITWGPYNNYFFLTLDTVGAVKETMAAIDYKTSTGYLFDYYIPNYGLGTKQPICATRANTVALYTMNGTTIHKRDLLSGAVLASAAIPGGSAATGFFGGRKLPNNAGIDIDNCGNVYVGSTNQLVKYDGNLVQLSTAATTFPIYDVDVNNNGEVVVCGFGGGNGQIRSIAMGACAQVTPVCLVSPLPIELNDFSVNCSDKNAKIEWSTKTEKNNSYFTVHRSKDGINFEEIQRLPGNGNTNSEKNYTITDDSPLYGTSYYQLSQTDFYGKTTNHGMVSLVNGCKTGKPEIIALPNPFESEFGLVLSLTEDAIVSVDLLDARGQKIKNIFKESSFVKGKHEIGIVADELKPSIYFIRCCVNGKTTVDKIIKSGN